MRKHRLDYSFYENPGYYIFVLCTADKTKCFSEKKQALWLKKKLELFFNFEDLRLNAFTIMPDHLHLLLEIITATGNINVIKILSKFKQSSAYYFKKEFNKVLWQQGFYDHICRKDEELRQAAYYIFNNPVRKGLVEEWSNYFYSGGYFWDILKEQN